MKRKLILVLGVLLSISTAWAGIPYTNLDAYKNNLGFTRWYTQANQGRSLKIAIIDGDFLGFETEVGKSLPASTRYVPGSAPSLRPPPFNGTRVAQLLIAMMTNDGQADQWIPELTLYRVSNPSDFANATDDILATNVDLVLCTQVWRKPAGPYDFINENVSKVTRQGVIWVNSAGEQIPHLSPANNPSVITVDANDLGPGHQLPPIEKPELLAPSFVVTAGGTPFRGNKSASTIAAAGLAILKSNNTALTREDLLNATRSSRGNWEQRGLSLNLLRFGPTGPGCFWDIFINPLPGYLQEVISRGGVLVETTAAVRVMVPFDPIQISPGLQRFFVDDMIVALPQGGYAVYPRLGRVPNGAAEIFQRPLEAGLCRPAPPTTDRNFRL